MQERQVTLEGETMPLPRPFIVLATQNPIEYEGTYPLPEAQIDRFLDPHQRRLSYPRGGAGDTARSDEHGARRRSEVRKVCSPERVVEMQRYVEGMHVEDVIEEYIVNIVAATRSAHPGRGRGQPARLPGADAPFRGQGRLEGARLRPSRRH